MSDSSSSAPRQWGFFVTAMAVMIVFDVLLVVVAVLTLFRARRFYAEVMVKGLSRLLLRLARVRVEERGQKPSSGRPVFYMPNHPSIIDVFILTSLGLPRTRYFMSRGVWTYFPFAFASWLMGVFFTPPQSRTAERVRCFERVERHLRASGESVLGTPEGRIVPGGLGPFNRGVFHLATVLGTPVVPICLVFPPGTSPGLSFAPHPTTVTVHYLPEIPTADWSPGEVDRRKEEVRSVFVDFLAEPARGQMTKPAVGVEEKNGCQALI